MWRSTARLVVSLLLIPLGIQAALAGSPSVCLLCGSSDHELFPVDSDADFVPAGDISDVALSSYLLSTATLPCDLNGDRICSCADIDLLTRTIGEGRENALYDLNQDDVVDAEDREFLIRDLMHLPYGDSNLDGVFDSSDLVLVFRAGHYNDPDVSGTLSYCEGDWNGDGIFDSSDLVLAFQGGYETSPRQAVIVPEPAVWIYLWLAASFLTGTARRRSRHG